MDEVKKTCVAGKIAIFGGISLLLLGVEFLIFELVKFICFQIFLLAFIILLSLNILLIRYLVKCYIFIGSNALTIKIMLKEINKYIINK